MAERWTPDSWRKKPIQQVPDYPDRQALADVEKQLATFPPLVFAGEARSLKKALARVANGQAFLLQGGDCAESFAEHGANNIRDFFRVFLQMAVVLTYAGASAGGEGRPHRRPVRQAALLADRETRRQGTAELSRRHHQRHRLHRGGAPSRSAPAGRGLSPVGGDAQSAARLRARAATPISPTCSNGCSASSSDSPQSRRYVELADRISEALGFMQACGLDLRSSHPELRTTDFYTSHEALLLGFEQAFTRVDSTTGDWYATSGHMLWIGDRTRQHDHAHVEYARGIKNPLGLKCGPSLKADDLLRLIDILNPDNEAGPPHADRPLRRRESRRAAAGAGPRGQARGQGRCCGRAIRCTATPSPRQAGYKTRPFDLILKEVRSFFEVHQAEGTYAGGVHLEMTGQNVTECTGGARAISDADLNDRYHTVCDPRLNAEQAIDLAFLLAELLKKERRPRQADAGGGRAVTAA